MEKFKLAEDTQMYHQFTNGSLYKGGLLAKGTLVKIGKTFEIVIENKKTECIYFSCKYFDAVFLTEDLKLAI